MNGYLAFCEAFPDYIPVGFTPSENKECGNGVQFELDHTVNDELFFEIFGDKNDSEQK